MRHVPGSHRAPRAGSRPARAGSRAAHRAPRPGYGRAAVRAARRAGIRGLLIGAAGVVLAAALGAGPGLTRAALGAPAGTAIGVHWLPGGPLSLTGGGFDATSYSGTAGEVLVLTNDAPNPVTITLTNTAAPGSVVTVVVAPQGAASGNPRTAVAAAGTFALHGDDGRPHLTGVTDATLTVAPAPAPAAAAAPGGGGGGAQPGTGAGSGVGPGSGATAPRAAGAAPPAAPPAGPGPVAPPAGPPAPAGAQPFVIGGAPATALGADADPRLVAPPRGPAGVVAAGRAPGLPGVPVPGRDLGLPATVAGISLAGLIGALGRVLTGLPGVRPGWSGLPAAGAAWSGVRHPGRLLG